LIDTGLDLAAEILSFSDKTGRLKIHKIKKLLFRYQSRVPECLLDLEYYNLISYNQSLVGFIMTVKGKEFLNLYNDLKELVCLNNNLNL
jgi:predicted transcriptional regulator